MSNCWNKITIACQGGVIRTKLVSRIFWGLRELKNGQDEIQAHLDQQDLILAQILEQTKPPGQAVQVIFQVTNQDGSIVIERATSVEMKIMQQFDCAVKFLDRAGNPAAVDGVPEWSVDPDEILSLEPAVDGMSTVVKSGAVAGSAQVLCKADADLGSGVTTITGMLAVTVLPGDAVTVQLNPGEVHDTPIPAPVA